MKECPRCIGLGIEFNPIKEIDEICPLCKGVGNIPTWKKFDPFSILHRHFLKIKNYVNNRR